MHPRPLAELATFATVVRHRSFARAAAELGVSRSALSHAMRGLEQRLGVRLLNRTTRSVAPTDAGLRLLAGLQPALDGIDRALDAVNAYRERPAGTLRLNVPRFAALAVLAPVLPRFLAAHPDVRLEISVDDATIDIVERGFDAGIRFAEVLSADMVAVRVGPPMAFAVVAAPGYLERHPPPQVPSDLLRHACIGYRLRGSGRMYDWEFEKDGQSVAIAARGALTLDSPELMVRAALDGLGLAFVGLPLVQEHLDAGRLRRVLADWHAGREHFHLYYPSHRHVPAALRALIDLLRAPADASSDMPSRVGHALEPHLSQ